MERFTTADGRTLVDRLAGSGPALVCHPGGRGLSSRSREIPVGDALKLFNDELITTFDLRSERSRVEAPTLVVAGVDDFITGPVCARERAEGIAGAELVLLPECGHFVFVEQPERFAEAVGTFLAAPTSPAAA
jgi:pimeloyl-ACP methyl ester carboxylesterase